MRKLYALVMVLLVLMCILLWIRVPTREFTKESWFNNSDPALTRVEPDRAMRSMIARAKIAHFIDPVVPGRRGIFFDRAWTGPGNDVYLMFGLASMTDEEIVYFGARNNGRLFWKARESRSP